MKKRLVQISTILMIIIMGIAMVACDHGSTSGKDENLKETDVEIFKDTPAWALAVAVKKEDVSEIRDIINTHPEILNYQEPKYGITPVMWSVGNEKFKSAKTLLELGADPDIAMTEYGETPLFTASGYSWIDNDYKETPEFVELLLKYGADPNLVYRGYDSNGEDSIIEPGTSPLMNSIPCGIDKTIALVEAGADVDYKNENGTTASIIALRQKNAPEYAHYLIVEKKASVSNPYFIRNLIPSDDQIKEFCPVNLLRKWIFDLDSEEYQLKMEIVEEFSRQGVNYWDTEIDKKTLDQIKKLYPDSWEEYILKY